LPRDNVEIVRRAYDAFNRRDFDAALADVDDAVRWTPIFSVETAVLEGKEAVRVAWERQFESLDVSIEPVEIVAIDDSHVIVVARWTGRGSASGAPFDTNAAQLCTLRDGKLILLESFPTKEKALDAIPPTAAS
jgi:ketosteroid isomerase-like protein